ncbi:adenosine deaminase [Actinopolymorpha sp. B17G11]|uniref:adenosine deaminase n=1 Tax=Actinopolymorpha sp. B17G11 TaxID=3160861 RepID=UPI0032E3F7F9
MRDLSALPKAHLHLHLDGALRLSTYRELAAAAGLPAPLPTSYGSFADFGETIMAAARSMRTRDEVGRVVREIVEDAAAAGARWVEVSMWPGLFGGRIGTHDEAIAVVVEAGRAAAAAAGTGFGLVVAANRDRGPAEAVEVARLAATRAGGGVVGFGLDGDETAAPPADFVDAFGIARAAGLLAVPHAGELSGPSSIRDALDLLGADRLMHGVRAVEDPALVSRLAEGPTSLDVCPTSNVMLSVVPSLSDHPLPRLLDAGVACSVNADDPLLFDTDLLREYERCRDELKLTDDQLAAVARTSVLASAAPAQVKEQASAGIDAWLAS